MKYTFFLLFLLFIPLTSSATTLDVFRAREQIHVGDTFLIAVSLDTGQDVVNALEGSLSFEGASLRDILYTGSIVPLWVEKPEERESGSVSFVGVLPGGYQGAFPPEAKFGNVFTLVFEATKEGRGEVVLDTESVVYANDGEGTALPTQTGQLSFSISPPDGTPTTPSLTKDTEAPETFVPEVVSGELFGLQDKNVLVFVTQDKDSGVDRYERSESFIPFAVPWLTFRVVESPSPLSELDMYRFVYVRAVDTNENMIIVQSAPGGIIRALLPIVLVITILGILFVTFLKRRAIFDSK